MNCNLVLTNQVPWPKSGGNPVLVLTTQSGGRCMTFGSRSVFLRLMRVFLLEMDLLLPYEYTSHCTEPLSNRVGQDHHWISFCPWAIAVPSVDRLSSVQDDFTQACPDTGMCILQFLRLSSRRARVSQLGTNLPSSLYDLLIAANFVQFFTF